MSPIAKQRFIGSILLLCMLSGLAFFLIDSAGNTGDEESLAEPETAPSFVSSVAPIVDSGDVEVLDYDTETLVEPEQLTEPVPVVEQPPSIVLPPVIEQVEEVETGSNEMWSLQLASFTVQASADSLRKQVQTLGYEAKVEKAETAKGNIFRVRIGPTQDKLMLEDAAEQLQDKLKLQPQILKQIP